MNKQRVDFPVGENACQGKRGTPRGRLVELIEQYTDEPFLTCPHMGTDKGCDGCKYLTSNGCNTFMRLADYLLGNGVIVPPCKVGQTVYTRYGYSFKIQRIEVLEDKKILFRCGNDGTDDYMAFYDFEIGTDVFLTKEEAEQALNNIQNGNSCEGGVQGASNVVTTK